MSVPADYRRWVNYTLNSVIDCWNGIVWSVFFSVCCVRRPYYVHPQSDQYLANVRGDSLQLVNRTLSPWNIKVSCVHYIFHLLAKWSMCLSRLSWCACLYVVEAPYLFPYAARELSKPLRFGVLCFMFLRLFRMECNPVCYVHSMCGGSNGIFSIRTYVGIKLLFRGRVRYFITL